MPGRRYPDGHLFFRSLTREFPVAVRGEGCWITDEDGNHYLDGCGGAFVASLGHGDRGLAEFVGRQAARLAYVNGTAFTHPPAEELADEVARRSPGDLDRAYFLSSGSAAVEAALKLCRQVHVERGETDRDLIVALDPSYHGNTLLALSASAREPYRSAFRSWLTRVVRAPAPVAYRCACRGAEPRCPACTGEALREAVERAGPQRVAAVVLEPVGGSSTGCAVPPAGWLRSVRETCDAHGILLVADEVLTGAGRTGTWSALEPSAVVPDVQVLGKGLSAGLVPLSAVVAPRRLTDVLARGHGSLLHAQTHAHHPVACAAGLAVVRRLEERGLVDRCARMGELLHGRLAALRELDAVGDVRGRGLLAGVEFVADQESRRPFPREARFAERFREIARSQEGLLVWPHAGHTAEGRGDLACLAPPFTVSEAEIDQIVERFGRAVERTARAVGSGE